MRALDKIPGSIQRGEDGGAWQIALGGVFLRVIASTGGGWDHVSVSLGSRIPCWEEMEFVKRTFFRDDEYAMQLHVPPSAHINHHPNCLHLWRPQCWPIPIPPAWMVGPKQ